MAGATQSPAHPQNKCPALAATVLVLLLSACDGSSSTEPPIGSAAGSDTIADLSNDALLAPTPPVLDITIQPGTMKFAWENVITATRTSLYAFDATTRNEWLVTDTIDANDTQFSVPTISHQLPWHSRQYRIELCDAEDCISSLRVAVSGRASDSIRTLTPAVSLSGEAFGQSVAINDNATVAAIAEPLAGSISVYAKNNDDWTYYGSSELSEVVSHTRTFDIAISTSGDTIAVYANETDNRANSTSEFKPRLLILERLGESWFTTSELDISTLTGYRTGDDTTNEELLPDVTKLHLSGDGERVLLAMPHSLVLFAELGSSGQPRVLLEALPTETLATSLGVSQSLDIIYIASIDNAGLAIRQLDIASENPVLTQAFSLPMLAATADVQLASSAAGDKLVVFAWEAGRDTNNIPVAWQFQAHTMNNAATGDTATGDTATEDMSLALDVERSLRLSQATSNAALKLAANQDLSAITFAWQSAADAALVSVVLDSDSTSANQPWQHALELPQSAPAFAKSAFVDHLAMSHDGDVLMITVPREHGAVLSEALDTVIVNTGQILILQ